jgi:hypothetical protein
MRPTLMQRAERMQALKIMDYQKPDDGRAFAVHLS